MAYVDSTTATGNGTAPATAVPAGVAVGDIVILVAAIDDVTAVFDVGDWPADFTELAEQALSLDGHVAAIGWKRLTGADSGSYTFGAVSAGADWVCQALAFNGRHVTDAPSISATAVNNSNNASPVTVEANGVIAVDGDDLVWVSAPDVNATGIGTGHVAPTDYVEAQDDELGWSNLSAAYRLDVETGSTGLIAGTFTMSSGGAGWVAWVVRIPEDPAAVVPATVFPFKIPQQVG